MKNKEEIISDLKELVEILNDGKEGYEKAAEIVESTELKVLFSGYAIERASYAAALKAHIAQHGDVSKNKDGDILGALHRTWMDIKEVLSSNENSAILGAITTGEKASIEKYDSVLKDQVDHADHYELLRNQREGIQNALNKIEMLLPQYQD
jgi:uncharacterized protein (TIGR02284 family)